MTLESEFDTLFFLTNDSESKSQFPNFGNVEELWSG